MKVLMYGWEFPPNISGGLGIACYGITSGLAQQNIKISLILPEGIYDNEQETWSHIETIKIPFSIHPYITLSGYAELAQLPIDASLTMQYQTNLLQEVQYYAKAAGALAHTIAHDIIHAHDWLTILAGVEAKKMSGKPLVFHVHALEPDRSGHHMNPIIYDIEKQGMECADKIIAVSNYTKNMICQYYNIPGNKVEVIHNGVFASQLEKTNSPTANKRNIVLFLGRMTFQKGPFYFLDIAHKILKQREDVEFVVAGQGDLLHDMVRYTARLRIGLHVHFTGFLSREEVEQIYQMSKVYVMPSVSEPFGITCLEAVCQGVSVVISKNSGVVEVVPQALQADFWDVNKMVEQINALLDHHALRVEQLQQAKVNMHNLLWSKVGEKITNLYRELVTV